MGEDLPLLPLDSRGSKRYFIGFDSVGNYQWNRFAQRAAYLLHGQHLRYRSEFDTVVN